MCLARSSTTGRPARHRCGRWPTRIRPRGSCRSTRCRGAPTEPCRCRVETDPLAPGRFLAIVATPELFGGCDGSWSAGSGGADGEAGVVPAAGLDALVGAPRPRTTLFWFTCSTGPAILAAMARGEIEITHAAFETMASDKTVNYLRDLLVAVGVLRRLRHHQAAGRLMHGAISGARSTIVATARQADCDQYALERPGQAKSVIAFLAWTARTGPTGDLTLPTRPKTQPQVILSDQERWDQVDLLLGDDTIRLDVRIAGLFTLLFAQPLARIMRMRADQVTTRDDGHVAVTFDTVPIELPPPLARLVLTHLARRGQASYASTPDRWLFPGGIPGRHLVTENVRSQLVERGIQPSDARNAAMLQLAAAMPSAILADTLGRSPGTAARWAALSARDWAHYTAQRAAPPHE